MDQGAEVQRGQRARRQRAPVRGLSCVHASSTSVLLLASTHATTRTRCPRPHVTEHWQPQQHTSRTGHTPGPFLTIPTTMAASSTKSIFHIRHFHQMLAKDISTIFSKTRSDPSQFHLHPYKLPSFLKNSKILFSLVWPLRGIHSSMSQSSKFPGIP